MDKQRLFKRFLHVNAKLNVLFLFFFFLFSACDVDENEESGSLLLKLSSDFSITVVTKAETKAPAEGPSLDDFKVAVYQGESGTSLFKEWNSFSDMASEVYLPQNTYVLKASYGQQHKGAFEAPYYEGTTLFSIIKRKSTSVSVVCKIANTKVTLEYSDGFKQYFKDWTVKVASTGDSLTFAKDETRGAYFEPGLVGMNLVMTRQDGKTLQYAPPVIATEGGKHYRVRLDVTTGGAGGVNLVIKFDKTTEEKPLYVDISGDNPVIVSPPYISSTGFSSGMPITVTEGTSAGKIYTLVNARGKIKSCVLRTDSRSLIDNGWPEKVDLADATANVSGLKGITFTSGIKGVQMAEIDFTELMPLLPASSQTSLLHTFFLEVTDEAGKKNDEFTLMAQMSVPGFRLLKLENVKTDGASAEGTADVRFEMTSGDPAKIKVQAKDDYGIWSDWKWVSGKEPKLTNVANVYLGTIKIKVEDKKLLRLNYNDGARISNSEYLYGGKYSFELEMADGGEANADNPYVWATKAYVKVKDNYLNPYKLQFIKNDENGDEVQFEVLNNNVIILKGLDAGAENNIIVKVIGAQNDPLCKPFRIVTETIQQLPNRKFENWKTIGSPIENVSIGGKRAYFYYNLLSQLKNVTGDPFKKSLSNKTPIGWSNLNSVSMPLNATNKNTWYIVPSCLPPENLNSGVWIRNVSWDATGRGVDNNIPGDGGFLGLSPVKGTPNTANLLISNKSIGKLFLGEGQEGCLLSSRPISLQGWFKYVSKEGEKGRVNVIIKNGNTEIAKGEYEFSNSNSSTFVVDLIYSNALLKAERIFVTFVVTHNKEEADIKTEFNTTYKNNTYSSQETNDVEMTCTGSELYIDDLKLIYE